VLGKETQFASLELAAEQNGALGGISYKTATNPLPFETCMSGLRSSPAMKICQIETGREDPGRLG
jgi:hypothetical protein